LISLQNIFYFLSLFFSGLIAGLLFSYSCSVNLGLKSLANNEYLKAMQSINLAIQNPFFLISFIGLLLVFPFSTYVLYRAQTATSFYLLHTAMIIYFIGVFGITMFCNVPLNNQLAKFPISSACINDISTMRKNYEKPWNTYHTIRTIASIISFGLTILSIIKQKDNLTSVV
jgi:uncharacterized membrane protein